MCTLQHRVRVVSQTKLHLSGSVGGASFPPLLSLSPPASSAETESATAATAAAACTCSPPNLGASRVVSWEEGRDAAINTAPTAVPDTLYIFFMPSRALLQPQMRRETILTASAAAMLSGVPSGSADTQPAAHIEQVAVRRQATYAEADDECGQYCSGSEHCRGRAAWRPERCVQLFDACGLTNARVGAIVEELQEKN